MHSCSAGHLEWTIVGRRHRSDEILAPKVIGLAAQASGLRQDNTHQVPITQTQEIALVTE